MLYLIATLLLYILLLIAMLYTHIAMLTYAIFLCYIPMLHSYVCYISMPYSYAIFLCLYTFAIYIYTLVAMLIPLLLYALYLVAMHYYCYQC